MNEMEEMQATIEKYKKTLMEIKQMSEYPPKKDFERKLCDVNDIAREALDIYGTIAF